MDETQWANIELNLTRSGWSLEELDELNRKIEEIEARWIYKDGE